MTSESQISRFSRWLGQIDFARVMFITSLCLLGFGYGVATMKFRIFPYQLIANAQTAYKALTAVESETLMANAIALDAKAPPKPAMTTLDPRAGSEKLLISGGPYQLMQRCPKFGCLAWIADRQGNILHSWEVDLDALFADLPEVAGNVGINNMSINGLALQADGSLVLTIVGRNVFPYEVGIAKVSRDGKLLWKHWDFNHHWITQDAAGNIYSPVMRLQDKMDYFGKTLVKTHCPKDMDRQGINVYAPDGKLLRHFDLIDSLTQSDYAGLLYNLAYRCDPIHLNSIDLLDAATAAAMGGVAAGDMLVSLREPSAVLVLDKADGHVKKAVTGRTAGQHSPRVLPDGTVLVFDNLGGDRAQGGTRIARLDMTSGAISTVFPRPGETRLMPFVSDVGGHIEISPDGKRAMVTTNDPGRAIEIDIASGDPLWTMAHSSYVGPYLKANDIKSAAANARFKLLGVYYITDAAFAAAGFAAPATPH